MLLSSLLQASAPTCQPVHPDTDVCLVVIVSGPSPLEKVTVEAGRDARLTDKAGTVTFDVPKNGHVSIRAIAPPGYQVDKGRTVTTTDKSGTVPIVLERIK